MRGVVQMVAVVVLAVMAGRPALANDSLNVCQASSSYDLTLTPVGLLFERADPAPRSVQMRDDQLQVDGHTLILHAAEQQRLRQFQQIVTGLVPKVRGIAVHGVDLAAAAVREQAHESTPELAASGELDARVHAISTDLKARIGNSRSTRDWHGPAFEQYLQQHVLTLAPLLAGDLLQQAMQVAISGDLDQASTLRDRAANMGDTLQARVWAKLAALKPSIGALCPDLQRLQTLQAGLPAGPGGTRLQLLRVGARNAGDQVAPPHPHPTSP